MMKIGISLGAEFVSSFLVEDILIMLLLMWVTSLLMESLPFESANFVGLTMNACEKEEHSSINGERLRKQR